MPLQLSYGVRQSNRETSVQFDSIALSNYERAIETARTRASGPGATKRWLRESVQILAVLYLLGVVLPALFDGDISAAFTPTTSGFLRKVVTTVVAATAVLAGTIWLERYQRRIPASVLALRAAADAQSFTERGWWRKAVRTGVMLGVGIGAPVGLLLALMLPVVELPSSGRVGLVGLFLAGTIVWTVPAAFLMRWVWLRRLRHDMGQQSSLGDRSAV
jgi:hypothetical protein